MIDLSVVIPAYNEAQGIAPVLRELSSLLDRSGLRHELVVVDDGSNDGTAAVLAGLAGELPALRLVTHAANRGYGAALKSGIRASRSEVLAITDADGTYPNDRLPELLSVLHRSGADMVVGARTGANVHIPWLRRPAKAVLGLLANYLTATRIPDLNSGLRVFRRAPVEERFNLISNGFSFTTTVTLALLLRDRSVVYVPIDYARRTGTSKIRPIRDTLNFLVLILRACIYFEPLKVFLPAALVLMAAGLAGGAVQMVEGNLGDVPVLLLVSGLQILLVGLIADMISRRN